MQEEHDVHVGNGVDASADLVNGGGLNDLGTFRYL